MSEKPTAPSAGLQHDESRGGGLIPQVGMKMRYVKETFKAPGARSVNADHFGISGNYSF